VSQPPLSPLDGGPVAAAYAKARGFSVDEARRRLDVQTRSNGLALELREELGSAYAGVWFDTSTGDVQVGTNDERTRAVIQKALDARGIGSSSRVLIVRSSLADLEAAQADLNRMVAIRFRRGNAWTATDLVNNRVEIGVGKNASPRSLS